jgi:pimeloyl-ACP methyl ester carboxylesterase
MASGKPGAVQLNAFAQFKIQIDDAAVHFLHLRSEHDVARPLIVVHGLFGSIVEFLGIIDRLVNPTVYGGLAEDAFHVVLPSLPGHGFSDRAGGEGWSSDRTAKAWITLMQRLGYSQFLVWGSEDGAGIALKMAKLAPNFVVGIHLTYLGSHPIVGLVRAQAGSMALIYETFGRWSAGPECSLRDDTLIDGRVFDCMDVVAECSTSASSDGLDGPSEPLDITTPTSISTYADDLWAGSRAWASRNFANLVNWGESSGELQSAPGQLAAWIAVELGTGLRSIRIATGSNRLSGRRPHHPIRGT